VAKDDIAMSDSRGNSTSALVDFTNRIGRSRAGTRNRSLAGAVAQIILVFGGVQWVGISDAKTG
jgi:hypothetical protein